MNIGENRLENGSGSSLVGWADSSFTVSPDWSAELPFPLYGPPGFASYPSVFEAAEGGAVLSQTDSLSDLHAQIEAGTQRLWLTGDLGGEGSGSDGTSLAVEFLNGLEEQIGSVYEIGPPSPMDRLDSRMMLPCEGAVLVPAHASSARVTLRADEPVGETSSVWAADLGLFSVPVVWEEEGERGPSTPGTYTYVDLTGGQGVGCGRVAVLEIGPQTMLPSPPSEGTGPLKEQAQPGTSTGIRDGITISGLRLTDRRVAFHISSPSTVQVSIEKSGTARRRGARHATFKRVATFSFTARSTGLLTHAFRRPLTPGRYRIVLSATPSGESGRPAQVVRAMQSVS